MLRPFRRSIVPSTTSAEISPVVGFVQCGNQRVSLLTGEVFGVAA